MNILPKKRWHVRTRENIARVRKDEQEAAEEAARKKQRIEQADREARAALLRQRAKAQFGIKDEVEDVKEEPCSSAYSGNKHINFFEELEEGKVVSTKVNKEAVKEEKAKREAYEKRIGYLTYLGQDTVELTGKKPWYDKIPDRLKFREAHSLEETNMNSKLVQDPLTLIRRFVPSQHEGVNEPEISEKSSKIHSKNEIKEKKHKKESRKHKKRSSNSCSSSDYETDEKKSKKYKSNSDNSCSESETEKKKKFSKSIEQLRAERLKRERQEQKRSKELMAQLKGGTIEKKSMECRPVHQKYNSQFNPRIANQNYRRDPRDR